MYTAQNEGVLYPHSINTYILCNKQNLASRKYHVLRSNFILTLHSFIHISVVLECNIICRVAWALSYRFGQYNNALYSIYNL